VFYYSSTPSDTIDAVANAHAANLDATRSEWRWSILADTDTDSTTITLFYDGSLQKALHSGEALGMFERLANASHSAAIVLVQDNRGHMRSLLHSNAARFRQLRSSDEIDNVVRRGGMLQPRTMLQLAATYNSSQTSVWWQSAVVDTLGASGWRRVMQAVRTADPSDDYKTCHMQAEQLGGRIDLSPAWPHTHGVHLLSFVCFVGGVFAKGRPWNGASPSQTQRIQHAKPHATAWIAHALEVSGRGYGAYAGYASEYDTAVRLIGTGGVEAVQAVQASVEGAVELFGDISEW
jgi:hypothetical protein